MCCPFIADKRNNPLRRTQEKVNCRNKSSAASSSSGFRLASRSILSSLKEMSCCSAPDALVPLPKTFSSRINLSRRMNELAKQLQESEERVRNAVQTEAQVGTVRNTEISQIETTNLHQTSSFVTEPRVFGRDQERDKLINLLTNEESEIVGKVPVLAIVGTGGVGKTTLAQLVFNDPKVDSYFKVRLWICVSTRFDFVGLTREMLEGACGKRCDLSNLNELQNKLKNELESKRFLLVLDDMWEDKDKSQWDSMVAPLNYCMVNGSIILVTTRNQSVAEMVDARDNIIHLQGLDENAFLSFFSTCIFNDPNFGGNWRLRNIGQEIANKLKGNPLAAKTVSALLKKNPNERYWMQIRDSEEWKSQSGPNDIMPALRLSYDHMPFHLQRCFSYCAILPEDHPFTCEELVYLWMAQGFLDVRSEGKSMEDIGSAYFNDLFNRGFFQTIQRTYDEEAYYTFHDLLHDLACMVASKECLTINGPEPKQIPPTIRHFSILYSTKTAEAEEAIVRTLACLEGENLSTIIYWDELPSGIFQSISDLLKKTKFLRAVRLNLWSQVQSYNFNFQNFVSLRYLKLIMSNFNTCKTLPGEICRLYHLEVFEIKGGKSVELPNNFSDLVSLRHFIVKGKLHSKILGVGKLTSLQELNYFHVQQNNGFEIEQLGSLKEIGGSLHIWNLENVKSKTEASKARLAEKEKLDALYLQWNHGEQENKSVLEGLKPTTNLKSLTIVGYGGVTYPTWLEPSLIFLESLSLKGCKGWELLPPIGELEFLKHFELSALAVREIGPQCYGTRQSMKFPSLEELRIVDMADLEKWVWNDQLQLFLCFKKLKKLTIRHCTKLVDLPLSGYATYEVSERFPSLEILIIEDCPLVSKLPPLPYSSLLSFISIERTGIIKSMFYEEKRQEFCLILDQSSIYKVPEQFAFHELSSLRVLKISYISSLESLDLHSFVALEQLVIEECQSLSSLTFGGHLVRLKILKIKSCKALKLLPPIGELEFLKRLKLSKLAVREIGPQCYGTRQSMKFPSLEKLQIKKMPDLEKWVWSDQLQQFLCFKKLEELTIRDCPKLVDLPLSGSAAYEMLERFPSLESLEIEGCPLIFQLPPLPYSSLLSYVSIEETKFIKSMRYEEKWQKLSLILDQRCSLKVVEVLALHELSSLCSLEISHIPSLESFHELSSLSCLAISHISSMESFHENLVIPHLHTLEISHIPSLESLDLHSFVALEELVIEECQSLTSLTFGDQLVRLRNLEIISCKTLRSIKGLKSWVNLKELHFRRCPGFIAAWDSASKEIERTEPDFSLSLWEINGDSLALLTLPICKQLTSVEYFYLGVSAFTEEHEVSPQLLTSIDLVDIEGCKKNLQSFPFDLFPSLKELGIRFRHIERLPTSNCTEITDECKKLRNIKEVHFHTRPLRIVFEPRREEMIYQPMDADN